MSTLNVPKKATERREWIKYQLKLVKSSLAGVGRELNVSRKAVQNALDKPYPKMERAIASKIGVPPENLWPERYQGENRNRKTVNSKRKVKVSSC